MFKALVSDGAAEDLRNLPLMPNDHLLSAQSAAALLGISVVSLYDWLGRSARGLLIIRGQQFIIDYLQGGPKGQGRIKIPASEVERLKEAMRVRPEPMRVRRRPMCPDRYPGISVPLGCPE